MTVLQQANNSFVFFCFFDVTVSIFIKYSLNLLISAILQ